MNSCEDVYLQEDTFEVYEENLKRKGFYFSKVR